MNSVLLQHVPECVAKIVPLVTTSSALAVQPTISKSVVRTIPIIADKLHHAFITANAPRTHVNYSTRFISTDINAPSHEINIPSLEKQVLSDKVNAHFPKIMDDLNTWLVNGGKTNLLQIYDASRINEGLPPGKNTYLGGLCCQMTSHLMARELNNENYNVKLFLNKFRDYPCNHFYLSVDGKDIQQPYIVDPSYRQFFQGKNTEEWNDYNRFLYEENEPFFVGTRENMKDFVKELASKQPINVIQPKHETLYWEKRNAIDVTSQLEKLKPIMEKYTKKK